MLQQMVNAIFLLCFRLGFVKNVSSKFHLRIQIRENLLSLIKNLSVNDKVKNIMSRY